MARYPQSDIPLVGASGAVAGLMGAFAVRFWSTRIRMFYFYFFLRIRTGTFTSPAWVLLGLWFASEVFWASAADRFAGELGGVANLAHVGGFAFGAATATLFAYLKLEKKVFRPKIDAKLGEEDNTVVEEAFELREQGRLEEAWTRLAAETRINPGNWEANLALWDLGVQLERPEDASAAFLRCIRHELRTGERDLAVCHWFELTEKLPAVEVDLDFKIRMAEALVDEERGAAAAARIDGRLEDAFVVIDLLVDSLWSDKPKIRTVRLRSHEFDARTVIDGQSDPHLALLTFLANVVAISGASPLPDADSVKGQPFYTFASLAEYESKVFGFVAG